MSSAQIAMTSATFNTCWPDTTVSPHAKALIGHFFALVDTRSEDSGTRLAHEVFTENGTMVAANGSSTGRAAIAKSRERVWDVIASRQHEVIKVYTSNADGTDLLLIGKLTACLSSGKKADVEFVARIVVEETADGLRMNLYQVWSDQTPIQNLVKRI